MNLSNKLKTQLVPILWCLRSEDVCVVCVMCDVFDVCVCVVCVFVVLGNLLNFFQRKIVNEDLIF